MFSISQRYHPATIQIRQLIWSNIIVILTARTIEDFPLCEPFHIDSAAHILPELQACPIRRPQQIRDYLLVQLQVGRPHSEFELVRTLPTNKSPLTGACGREYRSCHCLGASSYKVLTCSADAVKGQSDGRRLPPCLLPQRSGGTEAQATSVPVQPVHFPQIKTPFFQNTKRQMLT